MEIIMPEYARGWAPPDPGLRRLRGVKVLCLGIACTGDAGHDRIIEFALVQIDALLSPASHDPRVIVSTYVDPEMPIPAEASRLHGIRDADVKGAPTWAKVWGRFGGWLTDPHEVLCAHNAAHVRGYVAEHRFEPAENAEVRPAEAWLDTLRIVKQIDGGDPAPGSGTLAHVCRVRGIPAAGPRAWSIAMRTAEALLRLIPETYALEGTRRPPDRPTIRDWLTWQNAKLAQIQEIG